MEEPASRTQSPAITHHSYVVGDIHGCCRTLRRMVEEELRIGKGDTLFLLGDYIDRGPDSKGVLDYLLRLLDDGFDLRPLLGNHEEMLLESAAGDEMMRRIWYFNGGFKTIQQFGVETPSQIPPRYLDLLAKLPRILTTDGYVLVHAGLDFSTNEPITQTSEYDMVWERNYLVDPGRIGGRTLVTGHTVTAWDQILRSLDSSHIMLDNGCFAKGEGPFGRLVALDLERRRLFMVENCD